jgi:TnsA endonuclease N terminal/TnsA endonuclease C terminal
MKPSQQRKIGPTRRSVSGIYVFRGDTQIPYESTLERDFLMRTEFSLSVLDVIPQPARIPFKNNGRSYIYTPDFLVYYRLGSRDPDHYPHPILVEVKPQEYWVKNRKKWLPKWKAAHRYAEDLGWVFHIRDESRIRDQALANIRFLQPYMNMNFPREESDWVLDGMQAMGSAPVHYILTRYFMGAFRAQGLAHIWHLLSTRKLDCDISLPLSEFTELWVPTNE